MKKKDLTLVLIHHKANLNEYETRAVDSCFRVFKNREICVVLPHDTDKSEFEELSRKNDKSVNFIEVDKKWLASFEMYNHLLIQPKFYELFENYKYILICQADVYALYDNLDYYMEMDYDYYASCSHFAENGFFMKCLCGGFSMRKVDAILENLKNRPDWEETNNDKDFKEEDAFFVREPYGLKNISPGNVVEYFSFDSFLFTQFFIDIFEKNGDIRYFPMVIHKYGDERYLKLEEFVIRKFNESKYSLCTVCDDGYFKYTYPMINSFIRKNDWIKYNDFEINIICDEEICKFSDENLEKLRSIDKHIKIKKHIANANNYKLIHDKFRPLVLRPSYLTCFYKMEVFNMPQYNRVFFFDSDMLFVNSVQDLFLNKDEILMSYDNFEMMNTTFDDYKDGAISTGVFGVTVNSKTLRYYQDLFYACMSLPVFDNSIYTGQFPEQHVFRFYFQNFTNLKLIPRKYNFVNVYRLTAIGNLSFMNILCDGLVAIHLYAK